MKMPNNFLKMHFQKCKRDYRHIICTCITLLFFAAGFLFPNSLPRLGEAFRDLGTSVVYYFCELFEIRQLLPVTINTPSTWKFTESVWQPLKLFPYTWAEFKPLSDKYVSKLFTKENFLGYWDSIGNTVSDLSKLTLPLLSLFLILFVRISAIKDKHCTDRNKKSKALKRFERWLFNVVYPVIAWFKRFGEFFKENDKYLKTWLVLCLLHFNLASIAVAFIGYYFYFSASFDFVSLYTQAVKLLADLTPAIRFIPGIVWLILGVWVYNYICRSMAFTRLYAMERANRAMIKERGVITTAYGPPGAGKTMTITSIAISKEIEFFDTMFEIMVERSTWFPNFPWQVFRDDIKKQVNERKIVDLDSCRDYLKRNRIFFDRITDTCTADEYQAYRKKHKLLKKDYTYGYDYTHYHITYNNELEIIHLYSALEEYAQAFIYFTVKTTLLFANYSIRTDSILKDLGNMPYRDNDFFDRPPEYRDQYSKHSHIIDFDMFRLGKKLMADNPKARGIHPSVYVVTEIDKEFKNMLQLQEVKANSKETNQKNDLHDAAFMMIRHADVIANIPIIALIFDLQRPEAWGAGGRELGEVMFITEKSDAAPVLPFFSPYWFCEGIFRFIQKIWDNYKAKYDVNRCDQNLFIYLVWNIISKINNHYDKIMGLFGAQTLKLEIQSGRMDGNIIKEKWRRLFKKDLSGRYRTDCLHAVWESYEPNKMYIDDFISYAGELGTQEENELQNSYFQNDIKKMKELNMA